MRLAARIPAGRGRVAAMRVMIRYDGDAASDGIDVTDVQLQPGEPTGVVPNPADVPMLDGAAAWRNGMVPRSVDEVIILSNEDLAAPCAVRVAPYRPGNVRVGAFRFGRVVTRAEVDGMRSTASQGWGQAPVVTERSDGHFAVVTDGPVHLTVGIRGDLTDPEPSDDGRVIDAHRGWLGVTGWHPSWADVVSRHEWW